MSPVAISGVDKQGVYVSGVQVKQALDAANEIVAKGVYDPTTLSAIDADFVIANIKSTVNIFGKVGTYESIVTVSLLASDKNIVTNPADTWIDVCSCTVAANIKKVILVAGGSAVIGDTAPTYGQVLYNAVVKATGKVGEARVSKQGLLQQWSGDGLGSEASAKTQVKCTDLNAGKGAGVIYGVTL